MVGVKISLLEQVLKYLLCHALSIVSVTQGLRPSNSCSSKLVRGENDLKLAIDLPPMVPGTHQTQVPRLSQRQSTMPGEE